MTLQTDERTALEQIISNLEERGFQVFVDPSREILPPFLQGFAPDAIAMSKEKNLLIEIVSERASSKSKIERLKELVRGQQGWELKVYLISPRSSGRPLEVQSRAEIEKGIQTVEELITTGHIGPSLLIAWATFEALCRALVPIEFSRPQSPGRLLETMASLGYLSPSDSDEVRTLIDKRNHLVHGMLETEVTPGEVARFVAIMKALLGKDLFAQNQ
jgi:uncharacterized protein YutE (UPF0331/DUF86 family)